MVESKWEKASSANILLVGYKGEKSSPREEEYRRSWEKWWI